MFRVSDLHFSIEEAFIDAFIIEESKTINFGLDVYGSCSNTGFERWEPHAQIEIFASLKADEISDWKMLDGKETSWIDKYDEEGEMYGSLYLFEHNPIYKSTLLIKIANEQFQIDWVAKTDINWDEKYGQNLELEIRATMPFRGIWCARKSEKDSLELVKDFFNPEEFSYTQTEHGVSLLVPKNQ